MKAFILRPLLLVLFTITISTALSQTVLNGTQAFPATPNQLLAALPAAPQGWRLELSQANTLLNEGIESHALRRYERIQTSAEDLAQSVELQIIDTGGNTKTLTAYGYGEASAQGTTELSETEVHTLIAGRFIVQVRLAGVAKAIASKWIERFQHDTLLRQASATIKSLPKEIELSYVDEIDPKKNSSYRVLTHDRTAHAELLKSPDYNSAD